MHLPKTENILSILKPMELKEEITNISNLMEVIYQNRPKYTVLPKDFFDAVLNETHNFKNLKRGNWVQIGVWKGGGSLFFKSLMNELNINEKLYLYDTFGKIPTEKINHTKDKQFVTDFNLEQISDTSYLDEVKHLFDTFSLNENIHFIETDVHSIKKHDVPQNIAFLFIDVDFFEPLYQSLELFYDHLISGGILIIDDYYTNFFNCKEAIDTFFKSRNINFDNVSERFSSYAIKIIKP